MTSLLTVAAKVINGDVGFLFQPAEEGPGNSIDRYVHPKGYGGGKYLRSKNIFSKIPKLISCHIDTSLSDNELRITKGQATAAAYRFEIIVKGKPAHAALPWQGLNPIDKSSIILQEIDNLNKEFKKTNDKENYGLITVSQIHSDECELNSLSSRVTLKGISRVSGEQTLSKFLDFMKNHEAKIELEAPPVINDNGLANVAVKAGKALKFKITEEPARFRDETAWAGPLTKLWVEKPESYNPGVKRILHFFTPSYNKRSGGLHSEEFNPNIEKAVNAQVKVLLEISDSISKNEVRKP
jgi:acetylornithine deacetylase/succinyl-diaminopimelate desuccinylase-like protein